MHHPQAIYSRDALSKALYSRMFDYIIQRVNDAMYIDDPEALTTGILDIYGFEIFGVRCILAACRVSCHVVFRFAG